MLFLLIVCKYFWNTRKMCKYLNIKYVLNFYLDKISVY